MSIKYKILRPPLAPRFHLPSKEELFRVSSNDHVKLMFQVDDDIVEKMWVLLKQCGDDSEWTGELDNEPIGEKNSKVLKAGKEIKFHPYDIVDIAPQGSFEQDALRDEIYAGVKAALSENKTRWWENTPVQILMVVSAIFGIYGAMLLIF